MGSVSPLIAVYEKIKKSHPETEFLFLGTKTGPEKIAVESYHLDFKAITAGKFRRYFSFTNLTDFFRIIIGFVQSLWLIGRFKPNAIMVAGSFVGVPVAWAGWLRRIPVVMHHQDIVPGLANKLVAKIATKITLAFEPSVADFDKNKSELVGNPVREEMFFCDQEKSRGFFNLKNDLPVVLVIGGGIGSWAINNLIAASLKGLLEFCQVIHVIGKNNRLDISAENYRQFEFLTSEMPEALCAADLVVSRAGAGALSEFSIAAKPAILIPIPDNQQEANARYFQKNNAAMVLSQKTLDATAFIDAVREIIMNQPIAQNLSRNITKIMKRDGADRAAEILLSVIK